MRGKKAVLKNAFKANPGSRWHRRRSHYEL